MISDEVALIFVLKICFFFFNFIGIAYFLVSYTYSEQRKASKICQGVPTQIKVSSRKDPRCQDDRTPEVVFIRGFNLLFPIKTQIAIVQPILNQYTPDMLE